MTKRHKKESMFVPRIARGPVRHCSEVELAEMINAHSTEKVCTVSTVSPAYRPECALVGFALSADGKLILHTHKYSRKWENLRQNPAVALSISAGVYAPYFQIEGTAELCDGDDRHRELEAIYVTEHPKALTLANNFTTGTILVSMKWARYYEWPRKTGHCTEWFVTPSGAASSSGVGSLVLRSAYPEEERRVWVFLEGQGIDSSELTSDLNLLAEEDGRIVGLLCMKLLQTGAVAITGIFLDKSTRGKNVGGALVGFAKHVVHSVPCCVLADGAEKELLIQNGFKPVRSGSKPPGLTQVCSATGSHGEASFLGINWKSATKDGVGHSRSQHQ